MMLFIRKNKENEEFSRFEVISIFNMLSKRYKIEECTDYYLVKVDKLNVEDLKFLKNRIAYNKEIGIVLKKGAQIIHVPEYPLRIMPCTKIKNVLREMSNEGFSLDISSTHHMYCYKDVIYERIKRVTEKEFEERKPHNKPGFMPFSLHPRFSKALYNVAGVKNGHIILDPFCGIAGTTIEGEILGIRSVCMEKYKNVCEKAYVNIRYYLNNGGLLLLGDAQQIPFKDESFDAIISDLPYGRSTKIEEINKLYTSFFEEAKRVVKRNKRIVIITNLSDIDKFPIRIIFSTSFYVHKSLKRYLYVIENV